MLVSMALNRVRRMWRSPFFLSRRYLGSSLACIEQSVRRVPPRIVISTTRQISRMYDFVIPNVVAINSHQAMYDEGATEIVLLHIAVLPEKLKDKKSSINHMPH